MKLFDNIHSFILRAESSSFWLWVLNRIIQYVIPFNRPHNFKILELGNDWVRTTCLCRRANRNHLRGIHACAIATVAEFSAGFLLLKKLDLTRYRLIMSNIEVEYLYQAREQIVSYSCLQQKTLEDQVIVPLGTQDAVTIRLESQVQDISGNNVARAVTTWQIKCWGQVRTKV